jgi:NAD(P)-dependent dehydrogenase (short-subunit alcohol dehydrogenase family)
VESVTRSGTRLVAGSLRLGKLHVLVNNAAISNIRKTQLGLSLAESAKGSRASNVSLDEVRAIWDTNVFGALAVYQAMLPLLRAAPVARVVNVSSGASRCSVRREPGEHGDSVVTLLGSRSANHEVVVFSGRQTVSVAKQAA